MKDRSTPVQERLFREDGYVRRHYPAHFGVPGAPPRNSLVPLIALGDPFSMRLLSVALGSALFISSFATANVPVSAVAPEDCLTTREFITALEFIRSNEDFRLREPGATELALKISDGCTGSASRFIRVAKLLLKSGLNRRDATVWSLKFAVDRDARTEAFISAFKRAYLEEFLDLDIGTALRIASGVSLEFDGDLQRVRQDFERLVDFCSSGTKGFPLPHVKCGEFAAGLARKGMPWSGGISKPFLRIFDFLQAEEGAALTTADAFRIADAIVTSGPRAPENFIQAYRYASSTAGLSLSQKDAVHFAEKLAIRPGAGNQNRRDATTPGAKPDATGKKVAPTSGP